MAVDSSQHGRGRASSSRTRTYHHGDLRQALLDAAQSLLEERGLEGFTLRECARRAGVSHAAPAHHFGDASGLLTAFATAGFRRLSALMQAYRDAAPPGAQSQLRAVGRAYIDFAIAHRAQFQLMFRHDRLSPGDSELGEAGREAAGHLAGALSAALAERGVRAEGADFERRLVLAWSAVHGFATLLLEGRLDGARRERSAAAYASTEGDEVLAILEVALLAPAGGGATARRGGRA
ncbi:TetR/AcrR family transcriptional regulator [Pigmentiphaga sp.]|uniref:TetR/AcrR family transcriptional regulator n=1 Tax=Pigmentiphaga sp. TaxID=1977564 RepID=UPI0025DF330B|nr:TetR/AcrR family transcriptional regulator [Pigmentiphaga sp.]MBX6317202.1 TetR/AcrR family transcriptional regulator [Pigmentiphaga sp.]